MAIMSLAKQEAQKAVEELDELLNGKLIRLPH